MTSYLPYGVSRSNGQDVELAPPPYLLNRHDAVVLDPRNVARGGMSPNSTVYVRPRLLALTSALKDYVRAVLERAAAESGWLVSIDDAGQSRVAGAVLSPRAEELSRDLSTTRIVFQPRDEWRSTPPDAWVVLQSLRAMVGADDPAVAHIGLDHLMTVTATRGVSRSPGDPYGAGPYSSRTSYLAGSPALPGAEFGSPGAGPRSPVNWFAAEPYRRPSRELAWRRPVVALLDSGIGRHPWLPDDVVRRTSAGVTAGIEAPLEGSLDGDTSHGTFIAGLVRQACPDADLLSIPVTRGDGAVAESELTEALIRLAIRQAEASAIQDPSAMVDVVVLPFGYYHELPDLAEPPLTAALNALARLGVVVVTGAGNDGTVRPMLPGALAEPSRWRRDEVPLLCVGAQNPDGRSVALFSNDGPWVTVHRPGAASVSTTPTGTPWIETGGSSSRDPAFRSTIDPDDFSAGFATWSGTSFAAAVAAGELAQALFRNGLDDSSTRSAVDRGWRAVEAVAGLPRP